MGTAAAVAAAGSVLVFFSLLIFAAVLCREARQSGSDYEVEIKAPWSAHIKFRSFRAGTADTARRVDTSQE
jgi:hypothetical protein